MVKEESTGTLWGTGYYEIIFEFAHIPHPVAEPAGRIGHLDS